LLTVIHIKPLNAKGPNGLSLSTLSHLADLLADELLPVVQRTVPVPIERLGNLPCDSAHALGLAPRITKSIKKRGDRALRRGETSTIPLEGFYVPVEILRRIFTAYLD
jgi:hypothetical protein